MSFPPPQGSHGSGSADGGFGPPQGFGPPGQPGPPQGFGPPGGGPMGPGGPGGFGQPPYGAPPPPPGGGSNGAKVAALVVGVVLVAALAVGGVVLLNGDGGDEDTADAKPRNTPSATGTPATPDDAPSGEVPAPADSDGAAGTESPDAAPSDLVPFVVLDPGECFDHPALSSKVEKVERRSCDEPHNGEVIANDKLTGTFDTEKELQDKVLELCEADAAKRLKTIPQDGRTYYFYAIYPSLATYKFRGDDTISCSLTLSNSLDGRKLTEPLPG